MTYEERIIVALNTLGLRCGLHMCQVEHGDECPFLHSRVCTCEPELLMTPSDGCLYSIDQEGVPTKKVRS